MFIALTAQAAPWVYLCDYTGNLAGTASGTEESHWRYRNSEPNNDNVKNDNLDATYTESLAAVGVNLRDTAFTLGSEETLNVLGFLAGYGWSTHSTLDFYGALNATDSAVASHLGRWSDCGLDMTIHNGAKLDFTGDLYFGRDGAQTRVTQDGGEVTFHSALYLSCWTGSGVPDVNFTTYTINGGTLTQSGSSEVLIATYNGREETVDAIVNQTGGTVTFNGTVSLGREGGCGRYNLSGGTLKSTGTFALASKTANKTKPLTRGEMTISGDATVAEFAKLYVGGYWGSVGGGVGRVNQTGGAVSIAEELRLGQNNGGNGTYTLSGGTLNLGVAATEGAEAETRDICIGYATPSEGRFCYAGGAINGLKRYRVGCSADSKGTLEFSGDVVVDNPLVTMNEGSNSSAELKVSGNAKVTFNSELSVSPKTATKGIVTVSGGELVCNGDINDNSSGTQFEMNITGGKLTQNGSFRTCRGSGSVATVRLSGGTFEQNGYFGMSKNPNTETRFEMTGGTWICNGKLGVGAWTGGMAWLDMTGGEIRGTAKTEFIVGSDSGVGHLTVGGAARISLPADKNLQMSKAGSTLTLNKGGQIEAARIAPVSGCQINFNGGVLAALGRTDYLIQGDCEVRVLAGGLIVDTEETVSTATKLSGTFGDGGITKRGSGFLSLTSTESTVTGPIVVEAGTLTLATVPSYVDVIRVAEGATLNLPTGSRVTTRKLINNGTITGGMVEVDTTVGAITATWTGNVGDDDVRNLENYAFVADDGRAIYPDSLDEATRIKVPYTEGLPSFEGLDVIFVVGNDLLAEGYSIPEVVKTAAAWYDPSDARTLTVDAAGGVTAIANMGTAGHDLDMTVRNLGVDQSAPLLDTSAFNGLASLAFTKRALRA